MVRGVNTTTTPAIIGALSALAGVVLSQLVAMLQAALERKHQRTALLRAKLEELADNLHQTTHWADTLLKSLPVRGHAKSKEGPHAVALSAEARRVYILSLLYFPRLKAESRTLMNALGVLYTMVNDETAVVEATLKQAAGDFAAAKKALDDLIALEAKNVI